MTNNRWINMLLAAGLGLGGAVAGHAALTAAAAALYPIVDTGQTQCYNAASAIACPEAGAAWSGQDAQTTRHAPSYTAPGDGTVTDNVTGLRWQASPDLTGDGQITAADKLTYSAALTYCDSLTLAGYTDWRLPDIKTLYSLIRFDGVDPSGYTGIDTSGLTPFIDTTYFPFAYGDTSAGERVIDAQYASSTLYVSTTANDGGQTIFGVNFADGRIKGYGGLTPGGGTKTFFVKCVRGNLSYGVNAFTANGDQTVTDSATGLMWAQADNGVALNWEDALAWVQTQNAARYLGYSDWRLPNAKELQSLVDYSRAPAATASAALDAVFTATTFTNEAGAAEWPWYWSSTTHAVYTGSGAAAVYVAFGRAGGWQKTPLTAACYTLLDVHGAGAQRSDPKTTNHLNTLGTACTGGTAYGLGPQGDVQRGVNYVRLVRSVTDTSALLQWPLYLPLVVNGQTGGPVTPTPTPAPGLTPAFTISQTLSDGAQRNTIAFDGLAFLTGNLGADSFFPPGKVADFWGFQYLRDNDPSGMGHNTDFLTRAALNMLTVLTSPQRVALITLARGQIADINQYALDRFVLMQAFRRELAGDRPAGSSGLSLTAVQTYSAQLYRLDGQISYERAQVMGAILRSLDASQRQYLDAMVGQGMLTWPVVDEPAELKGLTQDEKVAVMTYAGDIFSWYAGSLEADVYFCPERQGTYFGSFYMKDAPAVGNPGYSIPVTLTADYGDTFLKLLTPTQALTITSLTAAQRPALLEIVDRRQDVAVRLRQFMAGGTPAEAEVLSLMARYGELDGELVYRYATAFSQVNRGLSAEQQATFTQMRVDLLGPLALPAGAFQYSQAIAMPVIPNTDFLFAVP